MTRPNWKSFRSRRSFLKASAVAPLALAPIAPGSPRPAAPEVAAPVAVDRVDVWTDEAMYRLYGTRRLADEGGQADMVAKTNLEEYAAWDAARDEKLAKINAKEAAANA